MSITVLTIYTEKEYEPFDPYSRFYPAMPVSACFSNTALCTRSEHPWRAFLAAEDPEKLVLWQLKSLTGMNNFALQTI